MADLRPRPGNRPSSVTITTKRANQGFICQRTPGPMGTRQPHTPRPLFILFKGKPAALRPASSDATANKPRYSSRPIRFRPYGVPLKEGKLSSSLQAEPMGEDRRRAPFEVHAVDWLKLGPAISPHPLASLEDKAANSLRPSGLVPNPYPILR